MTIEELFGRSFRALAEAGRAGMSDAVSVPINFALIDLREIRSRQDAIIDALDRLDRCLSVPAAEYVPAIGDAFGIIDEMRRLM